MGHIAVLRRVALSALSLAAVAGLTIARPALTDAGTIRSRRYACGP